eukprot:364846-Chlamydomonas_euryale.AAC.1
MESTENFKAFKAAYSGPPTTPFSDFSTHFKMCQHVRVAQVCVHAHGGGQDRTIASVTQPTLHTGRYGEQPPRHAR